MKFFHDVGGNVTVRMCELRKISFIKEKPLSSALHCIKLGTSLLVFSSLDNIKRDWNLTDHEEVTVFLLKYNEKLILFLPGAGKLSRRRNKNKDKFPK